MFILLEKPTPYYKAPGDTCLFYSVKLSRDKCLGTTFVRPTVHICLSDDNLIQTPAPKTTAFVATTQVITASHLYPATIVMVCCDTLKFRFYAKNTQDQQATKACLEKPRYTRELILKEQAIGSWGKLLLARAWKNLHGLEKACSSEVFQKVRC